MSVFNGGPYGRLADMLNTLSSVNIEIIIIITKEYKLRNGTPTPKTFSKNYTKTTALERLKFRI